MIYLNSLPDWWPNVVGLDIETQASEYPNPFQNDIVVAQVSCPNGDVYVLTENFERLVSLLIDSSITKVIHKANFDLLYLQHHLNCQASGVWDTFMMERLLTAGKTLPCDLAATVWRRANIILDKEKEIQKSFVPGRQLTDKQLVYVENDVKYLHTVYSVQQEEITKEGLTKIADLEHSLLPVVLGMELRGICLDRAVWREVEAEELRLADIEARQMCENLRMPSFTPSLFDDFVSPINLDSWHQVLPILQDNGIEVNNTQDETLKEYLDTHPTCIAVQAYRDYRAHKKAASWNYPKYINPATGRVHTDYDQTRASTGRFGSKHPNLQNVPKDSRVRRIFIPSDGYVLISVDYSQQEMRIMAEISGDENFRIVCRQEDPHLANAKVIWNRPMTELKGKDRSTIKATNFCMNYGGGAEKFSSAAGISIGEGRKVLAQLQQAYPKVFQWSRNQRKFAQAHGYVQTIWGRKRWFPGIDINPNLYPNEPLNTPIQGTAADMIKRAMVRVSKALLGLDAYLLLQVHDELVIEARKDIAEEVASIVELEMMAAGAEMVQSVPCPAEAKISHCWTK